MIRYDSILIEFLFSWSLQSINVIESPQLRAIFLMLREELKDTDIPHRTSLRERILEVWNEHLDTLQEEMAVRNNVYSYIQIYNCFL